MNSGIYTIVNIVNGKIYIGSTINFEGRWEEHRRELRKGTHCNLHLQSSWNKYDEGAFEFGVLEYVDNLDNLYSAEQFWMDKYREAGMELYNIALAADCPMRGRKHTEETKQGLREIYYSISPEVQAERSRKISEANMGNQHSLGYRHTEEAKCAIGEAHKGKLVSEETRRKQSAAQRGKNNTMYGKHHSEEAKHKISNGNKGKKRSKKTRCLLSEIAKNRKVNPMLGRKHSEESKRKISDSLNAYWAKVREGSGGSNL